MARVVRVEPGGIDIEVADDESLMAAAERGGYRWPTVCGGQGTCQTCFVEVLDGAESCSTIGALEREGIAALRRATDGRIRLACQLRILGDGVTVLKRGVRPAATSL